MLSDLAQDPASNNAKHEKWTEFIIFLQKHVIKNIFIKKQAIGKLNWSSF